MLGMMEIKTVPYVPLSHPFVERLIGTVRREYLDRILFWTGISRPSCSIFNITIMAIERVWAGRTPAPAGCCRICVTNGICVANRSRFVPVAEPLSRLVPDSNRGVILSIRHGQDRAWETRFSEIGASTR
jgi:hypothetical protein